LPAGNAGRRRRKGWAAAGPQRPAYSGRGHIVSPRAQLVIIIIIIIITSDTITAKRMLQGTMYKQINSTQK